MAKDYYDTLGVSKSADADEIKSAYRKLARKFHPDINKEAGAQKKFTEIQHAYDILSDEPKRKLYDQFGAAAFESGGPGSAGAANAQQRGPHYAWSNVGGGQGGGFGADVEGEDVGSVFEAIFGNRQGSPFGGKTSGRGRGRARAHERAAPEESHAEITVDFLTAAKGGTQRVRIGDDSKAKTIDVNIPAGTEEGAQLRVRAGTSAGGDVILRVRIAPHEIFRRGEGAEAGKGLDLQLDLPVTIAEATLGATVSVPTLAAAIELQLPPGTASGKKLRLRGRGIHDPEGRQGDLYAIIRIVPPNGATLSEPDREHLRRIAATSPGVRTGPLWPNQS